eukprot:14477041-Alexandrium_andersonii.AAC.1
MLQHTSWRRSRSSQMGRARHLRASLASRLLPGSPRGNDEEPQVWALGGRCAPASEGAVAMPMAPSANRL